MPTISKYRKEKVKVERKRAFKLYKTGLTLREVALAVNRSHTWVAYVVEEQENLSTGS